MITKQTADVTPTTWFEVGRHGNAEKRLRERLCLRLVRSSSLRNYVELANLQQQQELQPKEHSYRVYGAPYSAPSPPIDAVYIP